MKKVIVLASLALLLGGALLLQTGCPQPLAERGRDLAGWQIQLNVQAPVSAMAIEVSEYEVTGLLIELYDPQGELLRTIEWEATEGPRSYTIAVQEREQYEISVTHYGQKDGRRVEATECAEFNIQAMRITVINVVPGAIGVIGIEPGESVPEEFDLTGYWDAYLLVNDEPEGPFLFYVRQTGNSFKSYDGTGTIDGSTLTAIFDDGAIESSGTIQSANLVTGTMNFYGMPMLFEFKRVTDELQFGPFSLSGDLELDTQEGLGGASEEEVLYQLVFDIDTNMLKGFLMFDNTAGLGTGTYEVVHWVLERAGPGEVNAEFCDSQIGDIEADYGQLQIDTYSSDAVSGEFTLHFEHGNWFSGSFDLRQPPFGPDSQVTLIGGHWFGVDLEPETCDGVNWSAGEEIEPGGFGVYFMDENGGIWLELYPATEMGTGTFNVPADMEIGVCKLTDQGDEIDSQALSGQLVITRYDEGIGMAGYFDSMVFEEDYNGATHVVSGAFDVSFEITGQRWTINF